jgi:hypothetical protein
VERALRGECRSSSPWASSMMVTQCSTSCHHLDPVAVSHTTTRPRVRRSQIVDVPEIFLPSHRHAADSCPLGGAKLASLLAGTSPNQKREWRWRHSCPRALRDKTPRLPRPPTFDMNAMFADERARDSRIPNLSWIPHWIPLRSRLDPAIIPPWFRPGAHRYPSRIPTLTPPGSHLGPHLNLSCSPSHWLLRASGASRLGSIDAARAHGL